MIGFLRDAGTVLNAPCREHAGLLNRAADHAAGGGLSAGTRFGLRVHLLICGACRRFFAQLEFITAAAGRLRSGSADGLEASMKMPADARERVRERLRRAG